MLFPLPKVSALGNFCRFAGRLKAGSSVLSPVFGLEAANGVHDASRLSPR